MAYLKNPKLWFWTILILAAMVASRYWLPVPMPHIQLPGEVLYVIPIGPWYLPLTNTMVALVTAELVVILLALRVRSKLAMVPSGLQNVLEGVIEYWQSQSIQLVGKDMTRRWLPLILTIFFLILSSNWSELIPGYDAIGIACTECPHVPGQEEIHHKHFRGFTVGGVFLAMEDDVAGEAHGESDTEEHGAAPFNLVGTAHAADGEPAAEEGSRYTESKAIVPFYRVAASDLNFTLALAIIAFSVIQYSGFKALGAGYPKKFFAFGGAMGVFVGVLEIVSELSRLISFPFRLFGNMFAGQVLIFVMMFLVPLLLVTPVYGLELFVGLIQAFVFAILTLAFMAQAVASHDEHHH